MLIVEPGDSGSIKIDQVRDIVDRAAYRPFEGRRRVVIIDEADALVPAAQNALLKTLEEPPSSSVFILVTSRPDVLLPTVRSRCPRCGSGRSVADDVAAALDAARPERSRGARRGGDGRRQRRTGARGERRRSGRGARVARARARAGGVDATTRGGGSKAAKDLLAEDRRRAAPAIASSWRRICARWRRCFATSSCLSTSADARALANPDVRPALERLTRRISGERGVRAFTAVDRALVALERNAGVKIVADWLVLQL